MLLLPDDETTGRLPKSPKRHLRRGEGEEEEEEEGAAVQSAPSVAAGLDFDDKITAS